MQRSVESLKEVFPGVHGRLLDVCKPTHRKFNMAVSVAAGGAMEYVVVDTKRTALEAIEYMRQQRLGRASFIPLDDVRVEPIKERYRQLGAAYRLCSDVIACEPHLRRAVQFAVGNTVVCDSLDDARDLCFAQSEGARAVTLNGHLISRSGAMTGGSSRGDAERASRWDERAYVQLKARREELERRLRTVSNRRARAEARGQLQSELLLARARGEKASSDGAALAEESVALERQRDHAANELARLRGDSESATAALADAERRSAELQRAIDAIESEALKDFSAGVGVSQIKEAEDRRVRQSDRISKELEAAREQMASRRAQLAYEDTRDFRRPMEKVEAQRAAAAEKAAALGEEARGLEERVGAAERDLEAIGAQLDALQSERAEAQAEGDGLRQSRLEAKQGLSLAQRRINAAAAAIERLKARVREVLREAQVEQVRLPLADGGAAASDAPSADMDFSSLQEEQRDAGAVAGVQEELRRGVSALAAKMDKLQPNMRAVQRFDDVSARLRKAEEELAAAQRRARSVDGDFQEVRAERHQKFMECYDHVQSALAKTYNDLTKSSKHPLGGNAYFSLENAVEPFEGGIKFNAMPPMKRFRDMEQLSGGEKTVAALALLFAIHSFRPAPFFVMDEIDAALDNVNVKKVCSFVRRRKGDVQSIIITHKDQFFQHADSLCGIARDREGACSRTFTMDLAPYDEA